MAWTDSVIDAFATFARFALIVGVYLFSKFFVQRSRKDDNFPARPMEIIIVYIAAIALIAFASYLYRGFAKFDLSLFIILMLPCMYGLTVGFMRDSKLSHEQRDKQNSEFNTQKFKNREFESEY